MVEIYYTLRMTNAGRLETLEASRRSGPMCGTHSFMGGQLTKSKYYHFVETTQRVQ